MKTTSKIKAFIATLLITTAGVMAFWPVSAHAVTRCEYEGVQYTEGSKCCQDDGQIYVCSSNGGWFGPVGTCN